METEKKFTVAIASTPSSGSIEDHLKRYILLSKAKSIVWRGLDMYAAKSGWFPFTLLLRYCFAIPELFKDKLAEKLMLTSVSWVKMFKAKILFVGPNEVSKFSFDTGCYFTFQIPAGSKKRQQWNLPWLILPKEALDFSIHTLHRCIYGPSLFVTAQQSNV